MYHASKRQGAVARDLTGAGDDFSDDMGLFAVLAEMRQHRGDVLLAAHEREPDAEIEGTQHVGVGGLRGAPDLRQRRRPYTN